MKSLQQIGTECDAQKVTYSKNNRAAHYCTDVYPLFFEGLRYDPINLLEIGVYRGNSLRMWREYFSCANIYGLERNKEWCFEEERIKVFHGSQDDKDILQKIVEETSNLDIIIDDAGHDPQAVINTFQFLFPRLSDNGIYVIEDLWTSYDRYGKSKPISVADELKLLVDAALISDSNSYLGCVVKSLHIFRHISVIVKSHNK
jgi:hypothetical protein